MILGPLPPVIGGIATHMDYLLGGPLKEKFNLIPVQTMSRQHGSANYHTEPIAKKVAQILSDAWQELRTLLKQQPDLVHVNSSFNSGAFWRDALYVLIARLCNKPVFLQMHGGDLATFLAIYPRMIGSLILFVLRRVQCISVLSESQYAPLIQAGLTKNALILPNMIDSEKHQVCNQGSALDRRGATFIVIASHFTIEKGVYDIIHAFEKTLKAAPNSRLIMVGGGQEAAPLIQQCREKGLMDSILFTGFIDRNEIQAHLQEADVFVLPSHSEGFPMVVLEAMACGLPVISTRVGAIPEMLNNEDDTLIFPAGDVEAMSLCMTQLAGSALLRQRIGQANRNRIENHYDMHIVSDQFATIYTDLISP